MTHEQAAGDSRSTSPVGPAVESAVPAHRGACPFCPLHCDDLDPASRPDDLQRCVLLAARWPAAARQAAAARADDATLQTARRWVQQARRIAIGGRIIDLETASAAGTFLRQRGADLLPGLFADDGYAESFARDGMVTTTLGDAAAAHQAVVQIGDIQSNLPRLDQRLARAGSVYRWRSSAELIERLAALRLALRRRAAIGLGDEDLVQTLRRCLAGPSVVFVIAPQVVPAGQQRPFWSTLSGLLFECNRQIRATLLRFDPAITLGTVLAWTGTTAAGPVAAIAADQYELLIELTPWDESHRPIDAARRITIGSSPQGASPGRLHLRAAAPGVAVGGIVIRGDGSVTLPLVPRLSTHLPSAADLLAQLSNHGR